MIPSWRLLLKGLVATTRMVAEWIGFVVISGLIGLLAGADLTQAAGLGFGVASVLTLVISLPAKAPAAAKSETKDEIPASG